VQINDRGPFVAGRIIDLDREAFKKIAPLGAGVIDIKMEEIIP
jgi:rare lipoprotein A